MKSATAEGPGGLSVTLIAPPPDLAPYISAYYRTVAGPSETQADCLPPEWANLRAGRADVYEAAIGSDPLRAVPPAVLSGPTSRITHMRLRGGRFWGIGLLPLGFAQFIRSPASKFADRFEDISVHPALSRVGGLLSELADSQRGIERDVERMNALFRSLLAEPPPDRDAILGTHGALLDEDTQSVVAIAALAGVSPRTLERRCARWFGFPPQLLLRRQRFLRSLGQYMLDPSMTWIDSLDGGYHDQAHFLRDFRRFMGMRPGEYRAMAHPIATLAAQARRQALGQVMQVLHHPRVAGA